MGHGAESSKRQEEIEALHHGVDLGMNLIDISFPPPPTKSRSQAGKIDKYKAMLSMANMYYTSPLGIALFVKETFSKQETTLHEAKITMECRRSISGLLTLPF